MGSDGAGKSTVSKAVAERLRTAGVRAERVDRWDIVGSPAYPTAGFMEPDVHRARACAARMPNMSRFLFLMWSVSHALLGRTATTGEPAALTLLDGYWMKHAASEIVYGLDSAWVEAVVSGLPHCERVLYLRIEPEQAWRRKTGHLVPYECGMDPHCTRDAFLSHQSRIQAVLDTWAERFGWLSVDAGAPPDDVAGRVLGLLGDPATGPAAGPHTGRDVWLTRTCPTPTPPPKP
ncbi:thymidylate kinase [Streptomyces griseofuscus]|uniref:thymidylate kinase n=1 Tax=Streptomyces griseofuscus TaxID=146922 RepID=UPI003684A874